MSAPIHTANDASGLAIHSVNAAELRQTGNEASASTAAQSSNLQGVRAASYAQTECKEASTASQSGGVQGEGFQNAWIKCPGMTFAYMEARIVLAMLLQRFTPLLVDGFTVVPRPLITLRPRHGMQMRIEKTQVPATIQ